jgi:hypothetical protein
VKGAIMRPVSFVASVAVLGGVILLPVVTPSCGGSTTTASGTGGTSGAGTGSGGSAGSAAMTDTCASNADCTWGEISHEIVAMSDCPCLYGCGYLPQTKVTATRRSDQYRALCNPSVDGKGQSCGVDDCALPAAIACIEGTCKPAPLDGGVDQ